MESDNRKLLTPKEEEYVAIAASVAGNCLRSLRYHFRQAMDKGCSLDEIEEVVKIARNIKERPINDIYEIAINLMTNSREELTDNSSADQ